MPLVLVVLREPKESACLALLDKLVVVGFLVSRANLAEEASLALLAGMVRLVRRVRMAKMARMVPTAKSVPKDLLERMVPRGPRVIVANQSFRCTSTPSKVMWI